MAWIILELRVLVLRKYAREKDFLGLLNTLAATRNFIYAFWLTYSGVKRFVCSKVGIMHTQPTAQMYISLLHFRGLQRWRCEPHTPVAKKNANQNQVHVAA